MKNTSKYDLCLSKFNFFDKLNEKEVSCIINLGQALANELYKPSGSKNVYESFIQSMDNLLFKEQRLGLMKAQLLSNVFFTEMKLAKFDINIKTNPLDIQLDYKVKSACHTDFFISQKTLDSIWCVAQNYYEKFSSQKTIKLKLNIFKTLQSMSWVVENQSSFSCEKAYKEQKKEIKKIKLLLEVEHFDILLSSPSKTPIKIKI